jgi:uncharacterized protein involved in exopolysaccharide biosynthesis
MCWVTLGEKPMGDLRVSDLDPEPADTRPLRAVVRYWPMAIVLASLGLAAGVAAGAAKPPIYTAETRLAIGAQGLSSYAIPGFALAAQELAADYARYVSIAQDESALKLALGARAPEIVGLSASPVPNSSVVSIEALSADSQLAMKASNTVAAALIAATNAATNDQSAAALLKQYNTLSTSVAQANQVLGNAQTVLTRLESLSTATPTQVAAAQAAEVDAATKYASLQLQQTTLASEYQSVATSNSPSSNLSVVQPAVITQNDTTKNEELYGLVGVAAGGALALMAATVRARLVRRRRNSTNTKEKKAKDQAPTDEGKAGAPILRLSANLGKGSPNGSSTGLAKTATSERRTEAPAEKNWPTRDNPPRSSSSPYPRAAPPKDVRRITPPAGRRDRNSETRGR